MGYTTEFEGVLKFAAPLTAEQELAIKKIIPDDGYEHTDDHPEWVKPKTDYRGYVQLVVASDGSGIEWDGNEKFYDAVEAVNTVILTMQKDFTDFALEGEILAQGEEIGDVWKLRIVDGLAQHIPIKIDLIKCPECGHKWKQ